MKSSSSSSSSSKFSLSAFNFPPLSPYFFPKLTDTRHGTRTSFTTEPSFPPKKIKPLEIFTPSNPVHKNPGALRESSTCQKNSLTYLRVIKKRGTTALPVNPRTGEFFYASKFRFLRQTHKKGSRESFFSLLPFCPRSDYYLL